MHFSHYCPEHNSKANDPKVFKLGITNDLGISYKSDMDLGRKVNVRVTVDNNTAWIQTL